MRERLAEEISVETLAELVELSPFHVFKQATGMSPLQFVIEVALEIGYISPSHFAKVFRRITGVTPAEFRSSL